MTALPRPDSLAVVHLARRKNGPSALRTFIASYQRHRVGIEHTLVLVMKGYDREALALDEEIIQPVKYERILLPDRGYDINAYSFAARMLPHRRLCFVNSFSVIQSDNWLQKLDSALRQPGVGLVGATGSWQSMSRNYFLLQAQPALRPRDWALRAYRFVRFHCRMRGSFPGFPNPHVRTNVFAIERELFCRVRGGDPRSKLGAYRFESGVHSLSRQVLDEGLSLKVVGRDGTSYPAEQWAESRTFWSFDQENLIVSDNQTRTYDRADQRMRERLSCFAWGK